MTLCSGHLNTAARGEIHKQLRWTRSQDGRLLGFIVSISWHPTSPHGVPSLPPFYAFISQTGAELSYSESPPHNHHLSLPFTAGFHNQFQQKNEKHWKVAYRVFIWSEGNGGGGGCYFLSWIKSAHLTLPNACDVLSPNNVCEQSHSSAFLVLQFVNILWLSFPSKDIVSHL